MRLFAIGAYAYINIDFIKEVWTDERKVFLVDGTEYDVSLSVFEELLEVLKPTMFGSQCEFTEEMHEKKNS